MPPQLAVVVSSDAGLRAALAADASSLIVVASATQAIDAARHGPVEAIAVHVGVGTPLDELSAVCASLPGIPVVLASEGASYELLTRALGLGVSGCLTGTLSASSLRDAIAAARRRHRESHVLSGTDAATPARDARRLVHYRRVFDESPLLILVTRERNGRAIISDGNPHAWTALGYRRDELIGRRLGDIYSPESRRMLESGGYSRALAGEFFAEERQLIAADGRVIETLLRAIPDEGPDGERGTIAFFADVSATKRSARQLQQSQVRHLALLDAIPDIVLRISADGLVVDHHLPGGASAMDSGIGLAQYVATHGLPDGLAAVIGPGVQRALEARRPEVVELSPSQSSSAAFVVRIVPSGDDEVVAILQDVTERRRTEAALRQRDEALRQSQKMEAIGMLAGGIAHDFNNLLTAILGLTQLVLDTFDADDPRRKDLGQVETAAQRAAALTAQLLAFSRRQTLEPQRLDVHDILASLGSLLRRLTGEDIELHIAPMSTPAIVNADRSQFEQALINLVVNARAAMPNGGRLTIATSRDTAQGDHVVLEVRDTGVGMTAAVQARVFEPFFTTKPVGEGTGLGLSMVYGFTQQSGGRVTVESEPGVGTTFRLYFPATEPSRDTSTAEARPDPDAIPAVMAGSILLVEDEPDVRGITSRMLRAAGYTVMEAASAEEALALWGHRHSTVDLLLSDVVMPGMNGFALAHTLRAEAPDLKVLLMSGYSDHPLVRKDDPDEPARMLRKPFTLDELRRRVYEVLSGDHTHEP